MNDTFSCKAQLIGSDDINFRVQCLNYIETVCDFLLKKNHYKATFRNERMKIKDRRLLVGHIYLEIKMSLLQTLFKTEFNTMSKNDQTLTLKFSMLQNITLYRKENIMTVIGNICM